jgi:dTDP-D-glucose 4,6-dehydratase
VGESLKVGGHHERTNPELVTTVCDLLDELLADSSHHSIGS